MSLGSYSLPKKRHLDRIPGNAAWWSISPRGLNSLVEIHHILVLHCLLTDCAQPLKVICGCCHDFGLKITTRQRISEEKKGRRTIRRSYDCGYTRPGPRDVDPWKASIQSFRPIIHMEFIFTVKINKVRQYCLQR